jgi:CubicO group peptidase (beta-lactamase class C family)
LTTQLMPSRPHHRLSRRRLVTNSISAAAMAAAAPAFLRNTLAAQTPGATPTAGFDAFTSELSARIREGMTTRGIPGIAVGVISGDQEFTAGFGVTNINHPLAVAVDTLFQIGSIGKTYTATAMMRLVEDGRVDLDAPVRTYLPDFQVADEAVAAAVTVRQLMNHSAGWIGDDFTDTGTGDDALARYVALQVENPQISPLGAHFSYNNVSFSIAGHLIEVVTGKTYREALTELVLEPLGLNDTYLYPEQVMTRAFTVGHTGTEKGGFAGDLMVVEEWALPRSAAPAGAHICSVTDLMRYARFHLGDGTNADGEVVLAPERMAAFRTQTHTGGALVDVMIDGFAAAWMLRDLHGTMIQQHGGATNGQHALLVLVPERQFAIGVLTNATAGIVFHTEVADWALERYLGLSAREFTPIDTSGLDLSQYAGTYGYPSKDDMGQDIVVVEANGELTAHAEGPDGSRIHTDGPLVFVGEDLVQIPIYGIPQLSDFVRDDSGEVAWLRFGGRLQPKVSD